MPHLITLFKSRDLWPVFCSSLAKKSRFLFYCSAVISYILFCNILFCNLLLSDCCLLSYYFKYSSSLGSFFTYFFFTMSADFFCRFANDLERRLSQLTTIDFTWLNILCSGYSLVILGILVTLWFLTIYNYFSYVLFLWGNDFFNNSGSLNFLYVYSTYIKEYLSVWFLHHDYKEMV